MAIGAGAILVAIDTRSPSPVLSIGSMAAGVVSAAFIVGQHFLFLNPLFTDESTGKIPVFNLLFLAYLLPARRGRRAGALRTGQAPAMVFGDARAARLGAGVRLCDAVGQAAVPGRVHRRSGPAWASSRPIPIRRSGWPWASALLVAGVRLKSQVLRIASAVLIAVAVAKVFIFDMSELEGVLRAFSFIGLGAVLIGIGLFYQRLLTQAATPTDDALRRRRRPADDLNGDQAE